MGSTSVPWSLLGGIIFSAMSEVSKIEMILADGVRHLAIDDASALVPFRGTSTSGDGSGTGTALRCAGPKFPLRKRFPFPERKIRDRGTEAPRGASAVGSQRGLAGSRIADSAGPRRGVDPL